MYEGTPVLPLFACVASPTKKKPTLRTNRLLEQIHDWKHLYLSIFLVMLILLSLQPHCRSKMHHPAIDA